MLAKFDQVVQIEDIEGRKGAKLNVPVCFEGHTLAVDMEFTGREERLSGRFKCEFVLGHSFVGVQTEPGEVDHGIGFSNIALSEQSARIKEIVCSYCRADRPDKIKEARLRFVYGDEERVVQRLIVRLEEQSADEAFKYSSTIVNQMLDFLTYRKGVPLEVRRVEILDDESGRPIRSYVRFPYRTPREVVPRDLEDAAKVPARARAALRMYREAVNSENVFYRCLCLYRLFEGLEKLRGLNNAEARRKGVQLTREKVLVPDNELTRTAFPEYVNVPLGKFQEYVRSQFRLNIAHLNLNEFENLLLDPGNVREQHKVDRVNAVLLHLGREAIQAEVRFMAEGCLGED